MGLANGAVALAVFVLGEPLWMLRLSFEAVEMELVPGEPSRLRFRTRWSTSERATSDLRSIHVHVGPVSNLANGNGAPGIRGRIYLRFATGRPKRVPLIRDAGWGPIVTALQAEHPRIDVFETRYRSRKRLR